MTQQSFTGWQPQQPVAERRRPGGPVWAWALLGLALLLPSVLMLLDFWAIALVGGIMSLAAGSGAGPVLGGVLLLAAGPLAGLAVAASALLSPQVRRLERAALFALLSFGLLVGTSIEYFGWIRPALG
ncbi:hypothetical protein ACWEQL_16235 [Kitasatospora sp. NPDC004240]